MESLKYFRSYIPAIFVGFVWMPIFFKVLTYLDKTQDQFVQFLWGIFGFMLPVLLSTGVIKGTLVKY
jgi:hypothetical protein